MEQSCIFLQKYGEEPTSVESLFTIFLYFRPHFCNSSNTSQAAVIWVVAWKCLTFHPAAICRLINCHAALFPCKALDLQVRFTGIVKHSYCLDLSFFRLTTLIQRWQIWGKKGRGKGLRGEKSRAAAPFGLHVVLPDTRRRERGKGSASINSCYITSLCWCQVAERKERRGSAMTLFFSVVRPHPTLLLSVSFHSGFVSIDTDRLCVYPTLRGASRCSSLSLLSLPLLHLLLLLFLHSLLALTTMCYFIYNVISPTCRSCPCFSSAIKTQMAPGYSSTDFVNKCVRTSINTTDTATRLEMKV